MALPVLLGIPALTSWLGGLVASFVAVFGAGVAWLIAQMGAKLAIRVATGALFFTMFLVVLGSVKTLMSSITYIAPSWYNTFVSWVIPSNFDECVSIIISTKVAIWFWFWLKYYFEHLTNAN